ncbi:hypothetical protein A1O1_08989 [Capronia coronata CBS 617.96]|uniref:Uncharacterized protein n=1 Tax=Capronia coronata CBS 617.96 TaxID=1182541 RepID=W9XEF6_9EURO|nr:uncharacterized protein A1O1_08989 [Capronia coronata CBS 617.96]EXJ78588.1 hypothetical protein A1O1_08989 [Capronia coronata CBS 617.96]
MVRIKHRYLLFNILYPDPNAPDTTTSKQPTSNALAHAPSNPPENNLINSSHPHPNVTSTPSSTSTSTSTRPPLPSYVLFSRPSPRHLTPQLLVQTLRNTISLIFGGHGLGATQAGLKIVYFSPSTSTCILRVPRAYFRLVWASLTFMDAIPGSRSNLGGRKTEGAGGAVPCVVRVVRVSGTIRKSEEEVLRRARRDIVRAKRQGMRTVDSDNDDGDVGDAAATSLLLDGLVGKGQRERNTTATATGLRTGPERNNDDDRGIEFFDDDQDDEDDDMDDLSE